MRTLKFLKDPKKNKIANETLEMVKFINNRSTPPSVIQLHGSESIELCKTLKKNLGISIIKAINIRNLQDLVQAESYASNVDWLLFDYKDKLNLGGTGKSFDWNGSTTWRSK